MIYKSVMNFKLWIESEEKVMGININDSEQAFTFQILSGEKTIETRKSKSLNPYIGKKVGLIRTGVGQAFLVGYATVGTPVIYKNAMEFDKDYKKHLVDSDSIHHISKSITGLKWGYPLTNVEKTEPVKITSTGRIARKINFPVE